MNIKSASTHVASAARHMGQSMAGEHSKFRFLSKSTQKECGTKPLQ